MLKITNENLIQIIRRTFNFIDSRLIDHGQRVAHLVFQMLKQKGKYDNKITHDICLLALFHDMGAYKTDEINQMYEYETMKYVEHSAYGYLFLKYWSPLKEYAEVILHHHTDIVELVELEVVYQEFAQMIYLADFIDVYLEDRDDFDALYRQIERYRDRKFSSEVIDLLFKQLDAKKHIAERGSQESFHQLMEMFNLVSYSQEEIYEYLYMLVYAIDLRSFSTVTHTVNTAYISEDLAKLCGLDEVETEKVKIGAILHDIGKIGIPVEVLESPDKLNDEEMEKMRKHVELTREIIEGYIDQDIVEIAVRHHEKLNGTGYPLGLNEKNMTVAQRILAVADIVSALIGVRSYKKAYEKQVVIDIITEMSKKGLIDHTIVRIMVQNYDRIIARVQQFCDGFMPIYEQFTEEFKGLTMELDCELV